MYGRSTKCSETEGCFGMIKSDKGILCAILSEGYEKGSCPFKKPDRYETKGKRYPPNRILNWPSTYKKREFTNRDKGEFE